MSGRLRRGAGRKGVLWLTAFILLASVTLPCLAETETLLPDGKHRLLLPEGMIFQQPAANETDLKGIWLLEPDLEMLVFCYDAGDITEQDLAQKLVDAGRNAEVRRIGEQDFLVFQDVDESDGAHCIGYAFLAEGKMIEISFFYATQEAMDLTKTIMESFHI